MKKNSIKISLSLFILAVLAFTQYDNSKILSHKIDLTQQNLELFWKDEADQKFLNFQNLNAWLNKQGRELVFATNGGMYLKDRTPQGLFIQDGVIKKQLDTIQEGYGNFYLQPNGVFFINNKNEAQICTTTDFSNREVKFATQSGPMLVIDGEIHHKFRNGSKNLNIRNGVGILPNDNLIFAMSKEEINFFDFATYFKNLGCNNALYLDGFVSRTYLPSKNWVDTDGKFGVIIAETKKQ